MSIFSVVLIYRLNDVLQERDRLLVAVKSKSKYDSPTSSNAAMEALIAQNQSLREELTAATSQEQVQDVVVNVSA